MTTTGALYDQSVGKQDDLYRNNSGITYGHNLVGNTCETQNIYFDGSEVTALAVFTSFDRRIKSCRLSSFMGP